ncbi:hypothetical protein Dimus_025980 [Dionaea muscipula]
MSVIEELIMKMSSDHEKRRFALALHPYAITLLTNMYGNHVVIINLHQSFLVSTYQVTMLLKYIMNIGIPEVVSRIVDRVLDRVAEFSMDKYGSHFLQTCIQKSSSADLNRIVCREANWQRTIPGYPSE